MAHFRIFRLHEDGPCDLTNHQSSVGWILACVLLFVLYYCVIHRTQERPRLSYKKKQDCNPKKYPPNEAIVSLQKGMTSKEIDAHSAAQPTTIDIAQRNAWVNFSGGEI